MHVNKRLVAAASLWFSSIIMMVIAVSLPEDAHLAGWSILAAVGGCVPSGWLVVDHVVTKAAVRSDEEIYDIAAAVLAESDRLHSV